MGHTNGAMQVKTYVVLQKNNVARDGEPNEKILSVWLTRGAAQEVVNRHPGTRIEKHLAGK
ncbi:hypothetical protein J2J97_31790 (plasmid) [Rhizobium bangladeshense]|uniref:hypothetical protein n=1 Tax=Rhizobium bangladeshense TaxID=1138189 RepID=UPI001A98477E|nr:hypothetical protein [Rhizobium bangladeshense]QSY98654.1 hypothetical protein J2J97_31790 [Rhizobium bangladeshense]